MGMKISTHVDDIIIVENNPYKYMNEIEQHFQVPDIKYSLDYYIGNELFKVWNKIHVPSNKYSREILQMYQQKHGDLKKELLSLKLKEHP